jgi:putative endonuclease
MAEHNEIGKIGENLAHAFLMKLGFSIKERNYRTKTGEIDIIAERDNVLHIVEVKSIKVRDLTEIKRGSIQPEDNLTHAKWDKILKTIQVYLSHRNVLHDMPIQIDLACVYINTEKREGRVKLLQNVHKE